MIAPTEVYHATPVQTRSERYLFDQSLQPPWVMGAAGAGGAFLAMFTLGIMCWTDRRRKVNEMLHKPEPNELTHPQDF
jgi:hypothetical protein